LPSRLAGLLEPAAYPHAVAAVRLIETHISWVLLTGQFAYKIKRPVQYSFVDLRSPERRAFLCSEELRLNRRFSAELYLEVCTITDDNGAARVAGRGEVIEHAVRMREFRAEDQLDRLLAQGRVTAEEVAGFGRELASLHERLPVAAAEKEWGRPERVRALLLENLEQCLQVAERLGTQSAVRALIAPYRARLSAADCLASRRSAGKVRECHGDLHAGNIVRYGGRLLAFDCMEFEPAFRWIDVAEEVAFLFMDLQARGFAKHAQAFLGGYLFQSGDYQLCRLLRLYATHRALVRAKVAALQETNAREASRCAAAPEEHRRYVDCARRLLTPGRPRLILTCGVSGSGKTWLAVRLAPHLGAVHVRSDVERKRLGGLAEWQRSDAALEQALYSREMSARTYARLRDCAKEVLEGGYSVIVDATFHRREDRALLHALAADRGIDMQVIVCQAPHAVLEARLAARQEAARDASEADLAVLKWQESAFESIGVDENLRLTYADTTRENVVSEVIAALMPA